VVDFLVLYVFDFSIPFWNTLDIAFVNIVASAPLKISAYITLDYALLGYVVLSRVRFG